MAEIRVVIEWKVSAIADVGGTWGTAHRNVDAVICEGWGKPAEPRLANALRLPSISCRCRVRLLSVEMEGTFGRVYRGSYHEEGAAAPRDVLVKTAADHACQAQVGTLLLPGDSFNEACDYSRGRGH